MPTESSQPGIRECLKCHWLFVSPDVERIRRCEFCKKSEDEYQPRHIASVADDSSEGQDTS